MIMHVAHVSSSQGNSVYVCAGANCHDLYGSKCMDIYCTVYNVHCFAISWDVAIGSRNDAIMGGDVVIIAL